MKLTNEQLQIINSEEDNLIIEAKAGTGKTTTLIEYTKRRPLNNFLYLAFSSEIKKSSKKKFFGNTEVHTIHSLAYKYIGNTFKEKLTNDLKVLDIQKFFQNSYEEAQQIQSILEFYFSSKELILDTEIEEVKIYWAEMQNIHSSVKMTHNGYLKLFQSCFPELPYDYILIDEAQDSNEVMLDIIFAQKAKKIFVGDKDQEIFSFNNSDNIFHKNLNFKKYTLTKSFRFGENIAWLANTILNTYKENVLQLEGMRKDEIVNSFDERYTYLARTNAHLFDKAIEYIHNDKKVFIVGGANFIMQELQDAYNLYHNNFYKIESEKIKQFKSFKQLEEIAKKTKDIELTFLIKVITKYKDSLIENLKLLERNLVGKESASDITLSTIHKSKGLEFFNIELGEDFYFLQTKYGKLRDDVPEEEINLYYVAITRTIEKIKLNKNVYFLLENPQKIRYH